jgi:pimeloyl-ACP methyl ester carboxylesterase
MSKVMSKDGTQITFDRSGDGPPVVLVDGALSSRRASLNVELAAELVPHFTVYTYDRRGRGDSGSTPPYAIPVPDGYLARLKELVASGRRGAPSTCSWTRESGCPGGWSS